MSSDRIELDQVLVVREVDEAELAAVAFLARYNGRTLVKVRLGGPMRDGGGAGLITVRQVPATAARESNL